MKKTIITVLLFAACAACIPVKPALAAPGNSAESAILYDAVGKTVLYADNVDEKKRIASTTKILTALIVLENCGLDEEVDIKPTYTAVEGASIYLKAGETLTVRELLYGLMLSSGNDSAVALACYTAGSVAKFADMMNKKAASLGCVNSNFKNPHGLDAEGHYSSARDMAVITAEAMTNMTFREISATKEITIGGRTHKNHNKLLWSYNGLIGGKTGYTKASGRTLVTCAERDGMLLICVTLSDRDDWADHTALYDWAFSEYQCVKINKADTKYVVLPVISGMSDFVSVRPSEDFAYVAPKSKELTVTVEAPRFVYAGVIKGAKAGRIVVREDGGFIAAVPLVYTESVKTDDSIRLTAWEKIKWAWYFANSRGGTGYGAYYVY